LSQVFTNNKMIRSILIWLVLFSLSLDSSGQCDTDALKDDCVQSKMSGYTFLRSYDIDGQGGQKDKVEYSYVLAKGNQYLISVCADGGDTDGIVVTIYDSNRKKISSNNVNGEYYSSIAFPCNATGIYYITYTFNGSSTYCGGSAIGFKR